MYTAEEMLSFVFSIYARCSLETIWILFCWCEDRQKEEGRQDIFSQTVEIQIFSCQMKLRFANGNFIKAMGFIKQSNGFFNEIIWAFHCVLDYYYFFGFIYQTTPFLGMCQQTFNEISFPLSSALKVCSFYRFFFQVPHHILQCTSVFRWFDVVYSKWSLCSVANWI